jgi:hypothetical protein
MSDVFTEVQEREIDELAANVVSRILGVPVGEYSLRWRNQLSCPCGCEAFNIHRRKGMLSFMCVQCFTIIHEKAANDNPTADGIHDDREESALPCSVR